MQDHFIKNVNDLSLWMTFSTNKDGANTIACVALCSHVEMVLSWWQSLIEEEQNGIHSLWS